MVLKALGYIIASVATSKVQFWSPYKTWCYPTVYKADKITRVIAPLWPAKSWTLNTLSII